MGVDVIRVFLHRQAPRSPTPANACLQFQESDCNGRPNALDRALCTVC